MYVFICIPSYISSNFCMINGVKMFVFVAATLGSLEFSLLYEQENNSLQCSIINAKVILSKVYKV